MDSNEERLCFYFQLGLAITHWAHVEFAISWIVQSCFTKKDASLAATAFFSMDSFRPKLSYADAIISAHLQSEPELAEWVALKDRADQLSIKRNRFAHNWVLNDLNANSGRRTMLVSSRPKSRTKPDSTEQRHPGAICLRDVVKYRLEFVALMCALENFECRLRGRQERFPKSQEQPSNPPPVFLRQLVLKVLALGEPDQRVRC